MWCHETGRVSGLTTPLHREVRAARPATRGTGRSENGCPCGTGGERDRTACIPWAAAAVPLTSEVKRAQRRRLLCRASAGTAADSGSLGSLPVE